MPSLLTAALLALPAALSAALSAAPPAPADAAGEHRRYVSPLAVVAPGDPRIAALDALPPRPPSPNAPGYLLEAGPGDAGAVAGFVTSTHRAGRVAGVAFTLPLAVVPADAREAEAARPDALVPGLGAFLAAAKGADLCVLTVPGAADTLRARSYLFRKVVSEIRAQSPGTLVALTLEPGAEQPANEGARALFSDSAAYVDLAALTADLGTDPAALRAAADETLMGRPLVLRLAPQPDAVSLLAEALRLAPASAPFVAAALPPEADLAPLDRAADLLKGDFGNDARPASARTADGRTVPIFRLVSGTDLGGVVLVPARDESGAPAEGPLTLTLDAPSYASARVHELATGRTGAFDIPRGKEAPRFTLSTARGPIAVVLGAREPSPEETRARVGVSAERGLTAEEILARHMAWRAARDARWSRFTAVNTTAMRFRFAEVNNTLELTLEGAFFAEAGRGYDWAWSTAYVNGVRWRGKKLPELPLLEPEKVSELPLSLTLDDAYTYLLVGEETVAGTRCYALDFTPKPEYAARALHEGRAYISKEDFAVVRVKTRQLHLTGEIQSADETTDFLPVPAPDGGAPLRMPTHTAGQWVVKTFSRTTVVERETTLSNVLLDPPDFEERRREAWASPQTMVRDTQKGVRYLEKKGEERVVQERAKTSRLLGLTGVIWDSSLDNPLPLLGAYYFDLDFRKRHQQVQVFFGGVLLAGSFNEPRLFGSRFDLGVDVFGIAVRGTDDLHVDGEKDETQRVKQRSFAGNLNIGHPLGRHVKLTVTAGLTHRDYGRDDEATSPDFAIPSNHWVTRLAAQVVWDVEGWAFTGRYGWNRRSEWEPWGFAGNPDYDPEKDAWHVWSAMVAKDFHLAKFQRIRSSVSWLGSSNTDRFSKYTFGQYGGTSLRGFSSATLRAEQAVIVRGAYGFVVGDVFRLEGIYEHGFVKDRAAGLDWTSFAGAGLGGQLPGPWSTIVQLDVGMPVVGRSRGQKGFTLNLVILKIF